MPWKEQPDFAGLIAALVISLVSSFISITQRILRGYPASILWVFSEFMAAMLCGYLVWDIWPYIDKSTPDWLSLPILVAFAAHMGGRCFQAFEGVINKKWGVKFEPEARPRAPRKPKVQPPTPTDVDDATQPGDLK